MIHSEIKEKVRLIFATVLDTQPEEIPETPGLVSTLFMDSLLVLEVIVAIEQEFNIAIDDDKNILQIIDSLDSTVSYIDKSLPLPSKTDMR